MPDRSGFRQPFAEQPDRARVGNPIRKPKAQKPHERQPVVDQELRALVRQIVGCLDHQHLQHHHRIVGRSAAMGSARIGKRLAEFRPERFEVHNPAIGLELIAEVAQTLQPVIEIEEAWTIPH